MAIFGITSLGHDASLTAIGRDGRILFAGHAERYSRIKNDGVINDLLIDDAMRYATPTEIVWYEQPFWKKTRMAYAGQWDGLRVPSVATHLKQFPALAELPVRFADHHEAHAAAGYFTSPFDEAAILVVDAIGEWDTISLWTGRGNKLSKVWSRRYPHSVGLLYSAFTQRCGFKPNEEEYILMGMAAYGKPIHKDAIREDFIATMNGVDFKLKENVHRGIRWWRPDITNPADIAASIQSLVEDYMIGAAEDARRETGIDNLVLMGGVALNCVANTQVALNSGCDNIWIMPNPGDAGSSLGAAALGVGRHVHWETPYLGYDIRRQVDVNTVVDALMAGEVIGLANGRAEFGPRALGNRSLLTDPRGPETKDRVNRIKQRELFRPFAPVILEKFASSYFKMPIATSPYMQFVAEVRCPDLFPAITHVDGTARVQTLTRDQNPVLHDVITEFYHRTGCPMLLNTSLNIKGEPLVNTWDDALRFGALHGTRMF